MTVRGYSYTDDVVRLDLGACCVDITCVGPSVEWRVGNPLPPLQRSLPPILLKSADAAQPDRVFDRDAELTQLIGQRIRCAPSSNDLIIIWQPGNELSISSYPLADGTGWFLHYNGTHYNFPPKSEGSVTS